jgi:hypothetical protein
MKYWSYGIPALALLCSPALFAQGHYRHLAGHTGPAECQSRTAPRIQDSIDHGPRASACAVTVTGATVKILVPSINGAYEGQRVNGAICLRQPADDVSWPCNAGFHTFALRPREQETAPPRRYSAQALTSAYNMRTPSC